MLTGSEAESASSDVDAPSSRQSSTEAKTWSFRVFVCLQDGQTFSNLLDERKQQLETSLASASVISWACVHPSPLAFQDLDGMYLEGFVHASTLIRLGSLQRVLPKKLKTAAFEIMFTHFEEVKPGPGKNYMCHPTIKSFLEETSLDPLASDKRLRVDYRGSSASHLEIIQAKTWFGRGTMRCSDLKQVAAIFSSENVAQHRQATLMSAKVITLACADSLGPESAASSTIQVEVLVHSSNKIRRGTLESWLHPAQHDQIVKFAWEAVQTGQGRPYSSNPTVQKFLEESTLDPPAGVAGKRPRIDLVGPSGLSPKKCGRKPGYRKPRPGDADDAAGSAAGAGPAPAADTPSRAAPRHSLTSAGASQTPGSGSAALPSTTKRAPRRTQLTVRG